MTGRLRRGRLLPSRLGLAILANPFQFVVATLSVVLGVGVLSTAFLMLDPFTRVQDDLPAALSFAWGVLLVLGGGGTTAAMFLHDRNPARYSPVESAGLMVLGAAWTVLTASPFFNDGKPSSAIIGLLVSLACWLRVYSIAVAHKVTRQVVALHREVR